MILERSKNAKRNSIWGLIGNIVSVVFPFIVRTVIIKELGMDYLGLSSLFTSILTVLNITELGFGSAIVYSMYKPLAEDNTEQICALLNYYKKIYRSIGLLIFSAGCCLFPFLEHFIHGDVPKDISIYILYLLYLGNTALSYWLFAYKVSILTIYQRNDVKSKIAIILGAMRNLAQILFLVLTHNYYLYVIVLLIETGGNNILSAIYINKTYPQYTCRGKINETLKRDIRKKISGLMAIRISSVSRNAFDSIIVSSFLGLASVAIYNNYYYVINALASMMHVLTSAIAAGIGNSIAADSREKNLSDMNIINFWYMWISGWFTVCLVCLYQPFMQLWVGKSMMLEDSVMWLFSVYFLLTQMGDMQVQYLDATGLWWYRRWYSVAEAITNVCLNIVLGYFFGVAGVVSPTIITVFMINFFATPSILFKHYFRNGFKNYLCNQILYICSTLFIAFITSKICSVILMTDTVFELWSTLFLRAMICIFVPNIIFLLIYRKTKLFQKAYPWLRSRIGRS